MTRTKRALTTLLLLIIADTGFACVASEGAHASVHWHARRSEKPLGADPAQLLALGAHDR